MDPYAQSHNLHQEEPYGTRSRSLPQTAQPQQNQHQYQHLYPHILPYGSAAPVVSGYGPPEPWLSARSGLSAYESQQSSIPGRGHQPFSPAYQQPAHQTLHSAHFGATPSVRQGHSLQYPMPPQLGMSSIARQQQQAEYTPREPLYQHSQAGAGPQYSSRPPQCDMTGRLIPSPSNPIRTENLKRSRLLQLPRRPLRKIIRLLVGDVNVGRTMKNEGGVMVDYYNRLKHAPMTHVYIPEPQTNSILAVLLSCSSLYMLGRARGTTLNVFDYDCGLSVRMSDVIQVTQQRPLQAELVSTIRFYSPLGWYNLHQDDLRPLAALRNLRRVEVAWPGNRRDPTGAEIINLASHDDRIKTTIIQAVQRDVDVIVIRGGVVASRYEPNRTVTQADSTKPKTQQSWRNIAKPLEIAQIIQDPEPEHSQHAAIGKMPHAKRPTQRERKAFRSGKQRADPTE